MRMSILLIPGLLAILNCCYGQGDVDKKVNIQLVDICVIIDAANVFTKTQLSGVTNTLIKHLLTPEDKPPLHISSTQVHMAVVWYADTVLKSSTLSDGQTVEAVKEALLTPPKQGNHSFHETALKHVRDVVFKKANGDRENIKNILVMISDFVNGQREGLEFLPYGEKLKVDGVTIYGLAFDKGKWVKNKEDTEKFVSVNHTDHLFMSKKVDDFGKKLLKALMNGVTCSTKPVWDNPCKSETVDESNAKKTWICKHDGSYKETVVGKAATLTPTEKACQAYADGQPKTADNSCGTLKQDRAACAFGAATNGLRNCSYQQKWVKKPKKDTDISTCAWDVFTDKKKDCVGGPLVCVFNFCKPADKKDLSACRYGPITKKCIGVKKDQEMIELCFQKPPSPKTTKRSVNEGSLLLANQKKTRRGEILEDSETLERWYRAAASNATEPPDTKCISILHGTYKVSGNKIVDQMYIETMPDNPDEYSNAKEISTQGLCNEKDLVKNCQVWFHSIPEFNTTDPKNLPCAFMCYNNKPPPVFCANIGHPDVPVDPEAGKAGGEKGGDDDGFPFWIIIVVLLVIALIVVVIIVLLVFRHKKNQDKPEPSMTKKVDEGLEAKHLGAKDESLAASLRDDMTSSLATAHRAKPKGKGAKGKTKRGPGGKSPGKAGPPKRGKSMKGNKTLSTKTLSKNSTNKSVSGASQKQPSVKQKSVKEVVKGGPKSKRAKGSTQPTLDLKKMKSVSKVAKAGPGQKSKM